MVIVKLETRNYTFVGATELASILEQVQAVVNTATPSALKNLENALDKARR